MSSMARSMKREMVRSAVQDALSAGKLVFPRCRKKMRHKGLSFRKVECTGCGFTGRIK